MGGADRGPLRPFLHVTLSCSPGISLYRLHIFSSLSLTQTHEHMCLLYNIHIHFILMVTQGPREPPQVAIWHFLTITCFYCSGDVPICTISSRSAVPSCPFCVPFIWIISEHLTTARVALASLPSLTPLCCRTPAACVLSFCYQMHHFSW